MRDSRIGGRRSIVAVIMDSLGRKACFLLAAGLVAIGGCCCRGLYTKSMNEECCPTDIRKTHFWCFGEDALIHGPCGPKELLYGYEPTCWREWPACGDEWTATDRESPPEELPSGPVQPLPAAGSNAMPANPFGDQRSSDVGSPHLLNTPSAQPYIGAPAAPPVLLNGPPQAVAPVGKRVRPKSTVNTAPLRVTKGVRSKQTINAAVPTVVTDQGVTNANADSPPVQQAGGAIPWPPTSVGKWTAYSSPPSSASPSSRPQATSEPLPLLEFEMPSEEQQLDAATSGLR